MISEERPDILMDSIFDEAMADIRAILRGEDINPERARDLSADLQDRFTMNTDQAVKAISADFASSGEDQAAAYLIQGGKIKKVKVKKAKLTEEEKKRRNAEYQKRYHAQHREKRLEQMKIYNANRKEKTA